MRIVALPRDAERILGTEQVTGGLRVRINQWDHLPWITRYNTLRAPRTPYREITFGYNWRTVDLEHYGLSAVLSEEELWAMGFNPNHRVTAVDHQAHVAQAMLLDGEMEMIEMITDPATYAGPGHSADLAGGQEWNVAGGDLAGNFRTVIEALRDATGMGRSVLTAWMPYDALEAALQDTDFLESRVGTVLAAQHPTLDDLENYLKIDIETDGETSLEYVDDTATTETRAWGANCLVYVDPKKTKTRQVSGRIGGRKNFGRVYRLNQFSAQRTWFEERVEAYHYRRKETRRAVIANPEQAYLIANVKAAA
jgi:hypothetical protein